jgi:hypothetical protein
VSHGQERQEGPASVGRDVLAKGDGERVQRKRQENSKMEEHANPESVGCFESGVMLEQK